MRGSRATPSILADPRSPAMQKSLNLRVKYRESFRPFAPAVLREDMGEWFDAFELD
jgi:carbamoyltransferase